jgi:uncharacterized protein DUF3307
MSTPATAAVAAVTFAALFAGHQLGDHVLQSNADAAAKGAPTAPMLASGAHPWAGWPACLRHVATYTAAQLATLALVRVAAPLSWYGAAAALAVSAGTHAVIDRRWITRLIIRAKRCQDWPEAAYLIDQSLHHGALLAAAVLAAVTASGAAAGVVVACAAGVAAAGLVGERWVAGAANARAARAAQIARG